MWLVFHTFSSVISKIIPNYTPYLASCQVLRCRYANYLLPAFSSNPHSRRRESTSVIALMPGGGDDVAIACIAHLSHSDTRSPTLSSFLLYTLCGCAPHILQRSPGYAWKRPRWRTCVSCLRLRLAIRYPPSTSAMSTCSGSTHSVTMRHVKHAGQSV